MDKNGTYDTVIKTFATLINKEATDGWKYHSMETLTIVENPGCLGAIFGKKAGNTLIYMLIFCKE
jgi:hypothetical protein